MPTLRIVYDPGAPGFSELPDIIETVSLDQFQTPGTLQNYLHDNPDIDSIEMELRDEVIENMSQIIRELQSTSVKKISFITNTLDRIRAWYPTPNVDELKNALSSSALHTIEVHNEMDDDFNSAIIMASEGSALKKLVLLGGSVNRMNQTLEGLQRSQLEAFEWLPSLRQFLFSTSPSNEEHIRFIENIKRLQFKHVGCLVRANNESLPEIFSHLKGSQVISLAVNIIGEPSLESLKRTFIDNTDILIFSPGIMMDPDSQMVKTLQQLSLEKMKQYGAALSTSPLRTQMPADIFRIVTSYVVSGQQEPYKALIEGSRNPPAQTRAAPVLAKMPSDAANQQSRKDEISKDKEKSQDKRHRPQR